MVCIKIEKYHIDYDIFCYYDCNIFVLNVLIYKVIYLCINNLFFLGNMIAKIDKVITGIPSIEGI